MRRSMWVALAALACGEEFEAAIHLTIQPALTDGGWRVELRGPDGAALPGFAPRWVAASGQVAEVNLLVQKAASLKGGALDARLLVVRAAAKDGPALAQGTVAVKLEAGKVAEAKVRLLNDPRPLTGGGTLAFAGSESADGGSAVLDARVSGAQGWQTHLWLVDDAGAPHWMGRTESIVTASFAGPAGEGPLIARFKSAQMTLEATGTQEPLARTMGWKVYAGEVHPDLLAALRGALAGGSATVPQMMQLHRDVVAHAGFALAEIQSGGEPAAKSHAEHVHNSVGGASLALDLDLDGGKTYASADQTGMMGEQGYLVRILQDLSTAAETASLADGRTDLSALLGQAKACQAAVRDAASDVLDAATDLAAAPTVSKAQSLISLVAQILEPASGTRTFQCVKENVDRLSTIRLAPVARGTE